MDTGSRTRRSPAQTPRRFAGYLALAVALGMLLPLQARITGALGVRMDNGTFAGWLTSFVGLLFVTLIAAVIPSARRAVATVPAAIRSHAFPWWTMLAGTIAALFVVSQGIVAGVTGVALFTIAFVAGQTLGGIGVDVWGIGPAGRKRVTPRRLTGTVVLLLAVVLAVAPQITGGAEATAALLVLPFVAGLLNGLQNVMNGMQTAHYGSFIPATLVNFAVGIMALGAILLVQLAVQGGGSAPPAEPWLYLGGPLGVLIVGGSASLTKPLGVLLTSLSLIAGQLLGALLLDLVWPATGGAGLPWQELAGTLLAVTGVVIASLPERGPIHHLGNKEAR